MKKTLLCLCLLLLFSLQAALADTQAMVTRSTKLYTAASTKSTVYTTLKAGDKVTLLAVKGSAAKVQYDGKTLFMAKSALKKIEATYTTATLQRNAKVYKKASLSSSVAGTLKKGKSVLIYEESGDFYKIRVNGKYYYIEKAAFEAEEESETEEEVTLLTNAKVYKKADASSKVLGTLKKGVTVTKLSEDGKWSKIQKGSRTGYILTEAIQEDEEESETPQTTPTPTETPAGDSSKIEKVIAAAESKLGLPYVFGSTGPNSYDCSGLTRYAFLQVGITLPHSAYTQGYSATTRLTMAQLKRGDLIFFNTNKSDGDMCDHVGIYLGDGKFIHASSGYGRVIESVLTSGYYAGVFSWGRRIL